MGCHHPGPRLIWAQALGPSNWSLLFTPFPREQGHSRPWLKGSNFKHWVKKKVRSWLPPRCMHFRKMTLSAEARKEKMISLYSSLSPSFHKLQQVPIYLPGVPSGEEAVPWGSSHFTLSQASQSCLTSRIPSGGISSK